MAVAERAVFTDDTFYPPSQSAAGKNAFYLEYCTTGGQRPGYAVCLNKIRAIEEGRMNEAQLGGCAGAIQWKTCPALGMRDKEALEGRALYYVDREKQREWFTAQMKAPVTSAFLDELKAAGKDARQAREERKNNPPPAPAPKPTPAPIIGADNGYAAAINAAMQEASAPTPAPVAPKPAPKPVEPVKPAEPIKTVNLKPAPGESMLEFAKRMREARASA